MGMVVAVTVTVTAMVMEMVGGGSWCVAKIGVSEEVLQRALDSACGDGGADCAPIQPNRLCFSPNTLQAHASYAFNSFYQRNGRASNACLFDGASTIAQTDPSYGSCMYPSSAIKTPTARRREFVRVREPRRMRD
ncbi:PLASMODESMATA CALLOSE-BINDING PROTEIN 2 [Vigna angularis]|uniref:PLASMODESMATA CALLOSE-BINDING PROTEIN 2 n=1 Tax=Phaseolus angularis TaxID=3914 RepID=A0A8T0L9N0_PHAAN|nr:PLASMODESMATA CALLOSE-BINDING PROTEIN 2 [Vigna angularis]